MTDVILLHHAQGLTDGVRAFAGQLRAAGHHVTVPISTRRVPRRCSCSACSASSAALRSCDRPPPGDWDVRSGLPSVDGSGPPGHR